MNTNTPKNSDDEQEASELYGSYLQRRTSEDKIEQVMERLAEAGLTDKAETRATENIIGESEADLLVRDAYQQYRETRPSGTEHGIDSVMSMITAETAGSEESSSVENTREQVGSNDSPASSSIRQFFELPGMLLGKAMDWFRSGLFPKVAVPAMALAITAMALAPLVFKGGGEGPGGSQVVASYIPPASFSPADINAARAIDLDPGFSMGLSADSTMQSRAFALGRRLLEVQIVAKDKQAQPAVINIVASKLRVLGASFDSTEFENSIVGLADRVSQLPDSRPDLNDSITGLRLQAEGLLDTASTPWIAFGEATEAMTIASRLSRQSVPEILGDTLDSFNKMNFSTSLQGLSTTSEELLLKIGKISSQDLNGNEQTAERVRKLFEQLLLSVG